MKEIFQTIEENKLLLIVQNSVYELEAVMNASYKFTNKCFVNIEVKDDKIEIYFQSQTNTVDLQIIALQFNNELIDQQIRLNTGREFKIVREELLKKAFNTISK